MRTQGSAFLFYILAFLRIDKKPCSVSISISVIPKGFILAFRNGFAPVKIFYAIPSPLFSAAAELRALTPNLCHLASVPMIARLSNPLEKSCSIHPRRQYGDVPILLPSKNGS
jgi:hypothetical protein